MNGEQVVLQQQQQFVQSSRIGTWKEKKETQEHNKAFSNWLFGETTTTTTERSTLGREARERDNTTTTKKKRRAEVWHEIKQKVFESFGGSVVLFRGVCGKRRWGCVQCWLAAARALPCAIVVQQRENFWRMKQHSKSNL